MTRNDDGADERDLVNFTTAEKDVFLAARSKIGNDLSESEAGLFCRYYATRALRTRDGADNIMVAAYLRRLARIQGGLS